MSLDDVFASDGAGLLEGGAIRLARQSANPLLASFEPLQAFVDRHGRAPDAAAADLNEARLGTRLAGFRRDPLKVVALASVDRHGLLSAPVAPAAPTPTHDAPQAFEELPADDPGVDHPSLDDILASTLLDDSTDILHLRHVRPRREVEMPDEIATRERCRDFDQFAPIFACVSAELASGARQAIPFANESEIAAGNVFILKGLTVYVAEVGEVAVQDGKRNARLRLIFSNGTEGNNLLRSLSAELYKDPAGRRVTDPVAGPLFTAPVQSGFADAKTQGQETGTIYVLRSRSDHPAVKPFRDAMLKIGVTGQDLRARLANAPNEAVFLLGAVDVVAEYTLLNVNRTRLERLLHRIFAPARAEIEIQDRFGKPVRPREWFFVTPTAVADAVRAIEDGSIVGKVYDPEAARLVDVATPP